MKKYIVGALILAFFVAGGAGAYLVLTNQDKVNEPIATVNSSTNTKPTIDACNILTQEKVETFVGKKVQKIATPSSTIGSSDNQITTCNYMATLSENVESEGPKLSGANLLIYVARSAAGAESNKSYFNDKPENAIDVEGIGDGAYFNPDYRQLFILKGSNWYILTAYRDSIVKSTVEEAKELAEKLTLK